MTCGTPFCISDLWCIRHSGQIRKGKEGLVVHLVNVDIGAGRISPLLNMDSEYTGYIATMTILFSDTYACHIGPQHEKLSIGRDLKVGYIQLFLVNHLLI